MRICDLTTLYIDGGQGGVNTYLLEKARYLSKRPDVSHLIVVPGERDEVRDLFGTKIYTVKSRSLPSNPSHRVLAGFRAVKRILTREAPTLVEVDCAYMLGQVARKALPDTPIVGFYHVHLPTFIARPRFSRLGILAGAAEHFAWRYVDYCYRSCDQLVVTSPDMLTRLEDAGFSRLQHVPLGVNLDLFHPALETRQPGERPVEILAVGRLSREKDFETLIAAFQRLEPGAFKLSVVGEGPMREGLIRQAAGDPNIRFLGAYPYGQDLAALYRSADMLAVPSPNETFNLTVLEGLASGLPVVAVGQGGPLNLVTPEVGELSAPSDAEAFARCLRRLAGRRIDPAVCRGLVEERYSWTKTFDRLLEVYDDSLCAMPRSRG